MLLLITDRIFYILVRFYFWDVFLEMFWCFFRQFDRLANVSRARFIGLFLDPLSILAPHNSNLTVYVCWLFCVMRTCHSVWLSSGKLHPPCWSHQLPVLLKLNTLNVCTSAIRTYVSMLLISPGFQRLGTNFTCWNARGVEVQLSRNWKVSYDWLIAGERKWSLSLADVR